MVVTHATGRHALVCRAAADCNPQMARGLPGSSDVICGIRATARRLHPQTICRSSTALRAPQSLTIGTNRNQIRSARVGRAVSPRQPASSAHSPRPIPAWRAALEAWGTCRFPGKGPCWRGLPSPYLCSGRSIPGGRCSQGGVKFPTGGKGAQAQARERLPWLQGRVSRFGVIPKPTVKVRMKENGRDSRNPRGASFRMP